jgi:hypothetical protein
MRHQVQIPVPPKKVGKAPQPGLSLYPIPTNLPKELNHCNSNLLAFNHLKCNTAKFNAF